MVGFCNILILIFIILLLVIVSAIIITTPIFIFIFIPIFYLNTKSFYINIIYKANYRAS